ncbi:N5-glutamine methyltransferase, modifies release factors RF-1 and RF-2 [Haemophilus parainfluenzae]|uniref:Release factor glutamine methyltransferase n=1 Tax=Haemophilus parainfluenzae TaxID=729 RepID=A0A3S4ZDH1_HAEPA|nr:peptide chain release factor N(5)-glutamine methyltransferase [Haemophilus parainfluenzae]VEI33049.1 N5-glutamine methyltransferase, modifies release factors RF-1 and RF-2 [Haemophilus parainfluenzae]
MTYQQWLADAAQALNQVNPTENSKVDALVLLQHATDKSRTQILAFDETEIDEKVRLKLTALLDRRLKGEPIAYILGEKEFWSLPLNVSEGTLIPRPDTEILVEKALQIALEKLEENPLHFRILDLGTGTGAIALALASELSLICQKKAIQLDVIGVDLMPEVVKLAQSNAEKNQLKVQCLQSCWFEHVEGQFDIIVSNPPYIDETDEHLSQGDVRFEPRSALVAGENGLADLRHLIKYAPVYLKDNGYLLLEHGWKQGEEVQSIFWQNHWQGVATIRDYGDNERVTLGYWKR